VIKNVTLDVAFSVGIAVATTPHDPTDFVAQADRAAYRAKAGGRGRLVSVDLDAISEPQLA